MIETNIQKLSAYRTGQYWSERILGQLEYAVKLSKVQGGAYEALLASVADFIATHAGEDGVITRRTAQEAESRLAAMSEAAKSYHLICAAHAHIDMNWMWGWDETVAVTIDTFQTMLELLQEYPEFHFSQSQAAIYRIVEQYAPDMLEDIRRYVREGRWEVTASHWVEADKNMPNGESLSRHLLYTRRYLSELLQIDPASLNLDFEPDTFGHSAHVPEILTEGGVKYYYHCRGYEGHNLYRWVSPSGRSVIVYREPVWYNAEINAQMALHVPEFCNRHGMNTMLKVYGVGDHGGGPTRRDLERIKDMSGWPVFPSIQFGTFNDYFRLVDEVADRLPEVHEELNAVFTGCYTSQSRIKLANRFGEAALYEAEAFGSVAAVAGGYKYPGGQLANAWKELLFNQFHDILPGSGVIATREHAMGKFQEIMAAAGSVRKAALKHIAGQIDTSSLGNPSESVRESISQGAGAGFGSHRYRITQTERGSGKTRILHVFNPSGFARSELVEVTVWDWKGRLDAIVFRDERGVVREHQLVDSGFHHYWGHDFVRALVSVDVPALGYATYTMSERELGIPMPLPQEPRVEKADVYVMENEFVYVAFNRQNGSITSFIDKKTGRQMVAPDRRAGIFRWIVEDTDKGMSAWIVGRYKQVTDLVEGVRIRHVQLGTDKLRQSLAFEIDFGRSVVKATVSLDRSAKALVYDIDCDWQEVGRKESGIPQLGFHLPLSYGCDTYTYDVPCGTVDRVPAHMDMPGNSWICGRSANGGGSLALITDSKYGFRGCDDSLNVTLLRNSYEPDPYPDNGNHQMRFAICLVTGDVAKPLLDDSQRLRNPLSVISGTAHKGRLPLSGGFLSLVKGNAALSGIKLAEDGSGNLVVRLYEPEGRPTKAVLRLPGTVKRAWAVDAHEEPVDGGVALSVDGDTIAVDLPASSLVCLRAELQD